MEVQSDDDKATQRKCKMKMKLLPYDSNRRQSFMSFYGYLNPDDSLGLILSSNLIFCNVVSKIFFFIKLIAMTWNNGTVCLSFGYPIINSLQIFAKHSKSTALY